MLGKVPNTEKKYLGKVPNTEKILQDILKTK